MASFFHQLVQTSLEKLALKIKIQTSTEEKVTTMRIAEIRRFVYNAALAGSEPDF